MVSNSLFPTALVGLFVINLIDDWDSSSVSMTSKVLFMNYFQQRSIDDTIRQYEKCRRDLIDRKMEN